MSFDAWQKRRKGFFVFCIIQINALDKDKSLFQFRNRLQKYERLYWINFSIFILIDISRLSKIYSILEFLKVLFLSAFIFWRIRL